MTGAPTSWAPATGTSRSASRILDATLAALEEQGIEPERPPYQVREGGSFIAFVRDPDDYLIELIERG